MNMNGFPTRAPVELEERPRQRQWLVDTLWGEQAVGIVGGEPKCGKSMLALDLAVAVAAGVPCLRHFDPARSGPVLLFAAEDAGHLVRKRLNGIARAAGARFETLDIAVIDVPRLRLDDSDDRHRLQQTVQRIAPRLLILDPWCACTAWTRMPSPTSLPFSASCATCSAASRPPCCLSITRARAVPCGRARRCAAAANCTPGETATSTCAAAAGRHS